MQVWVLICWMVLLGEFGGVAIGGCEDGILGSVGDRILRLSDDLAC